MSETQDYRLVANTAGWFELRWTERDARTGRARSRTHSTRTKDLAVAEAVRRRFAAAGDPGGVARGGGGTGQDIGSLLGAYQRSCHARGVAGGTQDRLIGRLGQSLGAVALADVRPGLFVEYQAARGVAGAQDATVRRELGVLRAAFVWGHRHQLMDRAVFIDLPPEGRAREHFWPEAVEAELFRLAASDTTPRDGRLTRVGRFICLGLDTGARRSALLGLTWDRVDLGRGFIDFRDPGLRVTKKKRVATPITTRLKPVLERAARERRGRDAFVVDANSDIDRAWGNFMRQHNFLGATPHMMRHTRITLLLRAGVSVWDVSGLVGLSPAMIQTVYGQHAADDRLRLQADRRAATPPP